MQKTKLQVNSKKISVAASNAATPKMMGALRKFQRKTSPRKLECLSGKVDPAIRQENCPRAFWHCVALFGQFLSVNRAILQQYVTESGRDTIESCRTKFCTGQYTFFFGEHANSPYRLGTFCTKVNV